MSVPSHLEINILRSFHYHRYRGAVMLNLDSTKVLLENNVRSKLVIMVFKLIYLAIMSEIFGK